MIGDQTFIFKGTSLTRFTLGIGPSRIQVYSTSAKEPGRFERSSTIDYAGLAGVSVHGWTSRGGKGEAIYLHPRQGRTAMFSAMRSATGMGRDVTAEDQASYEAAAAELFKALAAARPDLVVSKGRPQAQTFTLAIILLIIAAIVSALSLWQIGDLPVSDRLSITGVITAIFLVYGVSRLKLLKQPVKASMADVAAGMASRLPARGPWGAAPPAHAQRGSVH